MIRAACDDRAARGLALDVLSICRSIIEGMVAAYGQSTIRSAGATFCIALPGGGGMLQ